MAHTCSCCSDRPLTIGDNNGFTADQTVAEVTRAAGTAVLERFGINHCCGAHLTLKEAAAAAGVPVDDVLKALAGPRAR